MDFSTVEISLFVVSVVCIALVYILRQQGQDLKNSYPPEVGEVLRGFAVVLIANAKAKAAQTPGDLDDKAIAMLEKTLFSGDQQS